jgi:hypothetical protein
LVQVTRFIKLLTVLWLTQVQAVPFADFLPDMPSAPAVSPGTPMSNSYLMVIADDESPQVRNDVVFHVMLQEVLGVCTDADAEANETFSCDQWADGETYMVITVDPKKSEKMQVMLISRPPDGLADLYDNAPRPDGPCWRNKKKVTCEWRYANFGPIANPMHFELDYQSKNSRVGRYYTYGAFPFFTNKSLKIAATAYFSLVYAPMPGTRPEVAAFTVLFQNSDNMKIKKGPQGPLLIRGTAYRCERPNCGLGLTGLDGN